MSKRLDGKACVVLGATSGIGEACARRFAAEGAKVILAARREEEGRRVAEEICKAGGEAVFLKTDITKEEDVRNLVSFAVSEYGRLDIALNAPGGAKSSIDCFISELDASLWHEVIDLNLNGMFYAIKHESAQMIKNGGGAIVSISSINSFVPNITMGAYCAAKAGLDMLSKAAAMEVGPQNVRINVINPGFVNTPLISRYKNSDVFMEEILYKTPTRRICEPEDIASAALFLLSDEARNMTAACVVVDGGEATEGHADVPQIRLGMPRV
ncbi:MAG: SDR family NAD(P)-dependent oxidoreductase [Christensenellales bacterium]